MLRKNDSQNLSSRKLVNSREIKFYCIGLIIEQINNQHELLLLKECNYQKLKLFSSSNPQSLSMSIKILSLSFHG